MDLCLPILRLWWFADNYLAQVVSGLGREIPSPNGQAIRGAIQTDAAINSGKSDEAVLFLLYSINSLWLEMPLLVVVG